MATKYEMINVRVSAVEQLTPLIKRFRLVHADGQALPVFSGGSHIIVQMQDTDGCQFSNAYSLIGDPTDAYSYEIGVRLEEKSKGGSAFMHQQVEVGDELKISPPNNLFALQPAANKHVLIAGGIGITPFLAQLHELHAQGSCYELHYAFRSPEHGAFQAELREGPHADHVHFYIDSLDQKLDLRRLIAGLAADAHLYVCGPKTLIEAVIFEARQQGVSDTRVHWEQFASAPAAGGAFTLVLARSGRELQVEEGISILQTIEKSQATKIESLCREGVCGTCETRILEGEVEHCDQYLSDEEKTSQQTLMICVSRARSARLVLDI